MKSVQHVKDSRASKRQSASTAETIANPQPAATRVLRRFRDRGRACAACGGGAPMPGQPLVSSVFLRFAQPRCAKVRRHPVNAQCKS